MLASLLSFSIFFFFPPWFIPECDYHFQSNKGEFLPLNLPGGNFWMGVLFWSGTLMNNS